MLTKQCITCGKIKDESEFDFRRDRQKLGAMQDMSVVSDRRNTTER